MRLAVDLCWRVDHQKTLSNAAPPGPGTLPGPEVVLSPAPGLWAGLVGEGPSVEVGERAAVDGPRGAELRAAHAALARVFRAELGLASDRAVIMSGHQAQFWHAGILAKVLAGDALARAAGQRRSGADGAAKNMPARAWLVVDQDASDSALLTYPKLAAGGSHALPGAGAWNVAGEAVAAELRADCAVASLGAFAPTAVPEDGATGDVARGLRAIGEVLGRHRGAASAAVQIAGANAELLSGLVPGGAGTLVLASRLSRTSAFRLLLEKMAADPAGCTRAYNEAVASVGRHDLGTLTLAPEKGRVELPLWQLAPVGRPGPRKRVFASTLGDVPLDRLAARALLMTGLLRWLGCEVFIHGTGGGASEVSGGGAGAGEAAGGYDRAAERWFMAWLGVRLAPSVVASATLTLPMGVAATTTVLEVLRARHAAHAAQHAPRLVGDGAAQARKDELVARIAQVSDRGERRALYLAMHAELAEYRRARAEAIGAFGRRAEGLDAALAAERVLHVRTWPWALHPRGRLLELKRAIDRALGVGPRAGPGGVHA
jgi:hypothetical protein